MHLNAAKFFVALQLRQQNARILDGTIKVAHLKNNARAQGSEYRIDIAHRNHGVQLGQGHLIAAKFRQKAQQRQTRGRIRVIRHNCRP